MEKKFFEERKNGKKPISKLQNAMLFIIKFELHKRSCLSSTNCIANTGYICYVEYTTNCNKNRLIVYLYNEASLI